MINQIQADAKTRTQKSLDALRADLAKIRTGRAHPSILDHVMIDYYGNPTPISQVCSINVSDSRTLLLMPWEKSMVKAIEKAILNSDLGLNPASSGDGVRVPMPPLTEDRRRELIKVVRGEAENAKVAVRNIRRDANAKFKEMLKDKEITEDEDRRAQDVIQKLTDQRISEIEKMLTEKEAELMEV